MIPLPASKSETCFSREKFPISYLLLESLKKYPVRKAVTCSLKNVQVAEVYSVKSHLMKGDLC